MRALALAGSLAVALVVAGGAAPATTFPPLLADATPLAAGDFDGDGRADLAVGSPFEDVDGERDAGVVNVLYGTANGLAASRDQLWSQRSPGIDGALEAGDRFGWALAVGDFDGDRYDDLAIGVPYESYVVDHDTVVIFGRCCLADWRVEAGAAHVLFGGPGGLTSKRAKLVHQHRKGAKGKGQSGDHFGAALAAGDFDGDGRDDLAIGVPGENRAAGAVQVFFGAAGGLSTRDQLLTQDSPGVEDEEEPGDGFGSAIAAGNFGYSSREADLAIGVPGEDLGSTRRDAGAVAVLHGQPGKGLSATTVLDLFLHQDATSAPGGAAADERYGSALAAGDFGRSAQADLAIGIPGDTVTRAREGTVAVHYGGSYGLSPGGSQLWRAGADGLSGAPQTDAGFGRSLAAGRLNGGGSPADLAIGVPNESGRGAVHVIYGAPPGLATAGAVAVAPQRWTRAALGAQARAGDGFGFALGAAATPKGALLAISAPGADRPPDGNTGEVHALFAAGTALVTAGAQTWNQDSAGVDDSAEPGDWLGGAPVPLRGGR